MVGGRAASDVIDLVTEIWLADSEGEEPCAKAKAMSQLKGTQDTGDTGEESDDDLCCPISEEEYEEKGPHQPLVLPACGHTFSRASVEALFKLNKKILCPVCNTKQTVRKIEGCPPNWDTIRSILRKDQKGKKRSAPEQTLDVSKRKKAKKPASGGHETTHKENVDVTKAADVDEAGPSDTGKTRKRKKTRSHSSEGKLSGDGASKATGTKRKKLKSPALVPAAAPMTGQSPLLEKIPKAEFDKQAVKLLGKAHKRRR